MADCGELGGTVAMETGFERNEDLDGDGRDDVVIDYAAAACSESPTLNCSTGGCTVGFFLARDEGYVRMFSDVIRGYEVFPGGFLALDLHGTACESMASRPAARSSASPATRRSWWKRSRGPRPRRWISRGRRTAARPRWRTASTTVVAVTGEVTVAPMAAVETPAATPVEETPVETAVVETPVETPVGETPAPEPDVVAAAGPGARTQTRLRPRRPKRLRLTRRTRGT
ncbi:MAG: hypothetical protein R3D59_00225 [Paracoccaceae bacterium]